MSVLSQGLTPPDQIPVATDQLPAPKEKLELLPSTSGPLHQFVLPPNLEGQAPILRPGRRPAAATREHPITPTPTAPGTAQPTSAQSGYFVLNPDNTLSPVLVAPGVSTHVQALLHLVLHLLILCLASQRGTGDGGPLRRRVEWPRGGLRREISGGVAGGTETT
ncbi:hypothetical protein D5F01_LYC24355 [Larimichthys crocea]|uniref:Uncharacterized protein n=1 Tax=Larimichthys crocea TaxID=215358 RepID=A0A6G0HEZ2_LARCR|nr:hypothetical protein D5F01_LYC24355 [Larimichthys crocea]